MTRFALPRVRIAVNCRIYNQPLVKKQCHGGCIESMCETLLQCVVTFLNLYLSCSCRAVQDTLRSEKIVYHHVVYLDPPIHKYSQDFSSPLFCRYIHVIKPLLNVKFSKICRFNSSLCLTSPSCIFFLVVNRREKRSSMWLVCDEIV